MMKLSDPRAVAVTAIVFLLLFFYSSTPSSTAFTNSAAFPVTSPVLSLSPLESLRQEVAFLKQEAALSKLALAEAQLIAENVELRKELAAIGGHASALPPPPPPVVDTTPKQPPPTTPSPTASPPAAVAAPKGLPYLKSSHPPGTPRRPITVLLYNNFHGFVDWWRPESFIDPAKSECSTTCTFTEDRSAYSSADGVLFHVKTHKRDNGWFPASGRGHAKQQWMMVSLEQPEYAPLMKDPSYVNTFDLTATYSLESDVPVTTVHGQYSSVDYHKAGVLPFAQKDGWGEPGAVAAFVSNCKAAGAEKRYAFFEELGRYIPLHHYGKCLHNKDEPKLDDNRNMNKRLLLQRYKFYLAFENNQIPDYVSEKVFDGLLAGTLPIYQGTDRIERFMPSSSHPAVIKMDDFKSARELADLIIKLSNDEKEYNKYFVWKTNQPEQRFQAILDMTAYHFKSLCRICQKINEVVYGGG